MSKVIYKVGEETYTYASSLHIISDEQLFQFEEHLMEDIKHHKQHLNPRPRSGHIHDVEFIDDNGVKATVCDLKKHGNLKINTIEL